MWLVARSRLFAAGSDHQDGRVAQTRQELIVNDYRTWSGARPLTLAHTAITASLGEPLLYRDTLVGVINLIHSGGQRVFVEHHGALLRLFADQAAIAIENARLFQQVQQLAITDPLTNLYNRRYFFEAARREYERAFRYASPMAIILIDLDHFKWVNDTYGHLVGDRVLVTIANRCRAALREVDILARFGGEEYILLLPQTNLAGALLLAERLRASISNTPVDAGNQSLAISASLGIAELDETNPDLHTLILRADQALYAAKHGGRNRTVCHGESQRGTPALRAIGA